MKIEETHKKILSCLVAFSLIISVLSINISATETESTPNLNTYTGNYYYNLDSNFGLNTEGTCTYVATGMLLSFYDSYLSDGFIDSNYDFLGKVDDDFDISSPGIKQEERWTTSGVYIDYGDFIDANADEYFHLKLMQIGRDDVEVYSTDPVNASRSSEDLPGAMDWSINVFEAGEIIQEYISQLPNDVESLKIKNNVTVNVICYTDEEFDEVDDSDVKTIIRNEMIEKIRLGIPVIYSGFPETGKGHAMVAYHYDETNDTVYFHTGWNSDICMTDKDSDFIYTECNTILWLDVNDQAFTHSHIYNYQNSNSTPATSLCACQLYASFSGHINNHYYITKYDNEKHYGCCNCGEMINVSSHDMVYSYYSSTKHIELCRTCDYINKKANHTYITPSTFTSEGHFLECPCGAVSSTVEAHSDGRCETKNTYSHNVYCKCGYLIREDYHNMVSMNIRYEKCRDCGYMRDKSVSGEIIKGIDDDTPYLTE